MRFKILWLLVASSVVAQNKKPIELGLQLENDSFVSTYNDFYYTNGTFLFGNYVSDKTTTEQKRIHGFRIGQQIFNPRWVKATNPENHNRPYAGYLFAEYSVTKMNRSNSVKAMTFQLGVVGPDSKAEQFQDWMHASFGFGKIYGWEYQIQNTLALQYGLTYSKPIFAKVTSDYLDFQLYTKSDLGTVFTGTNFGILTRLSLSKPLTAMSNSNFYNGLGTAPKECYFFVLPKINLQVYDATIQGSLFDHKSVVTFDLKPIRFRGEAGIKFKYHHLNLSGSFVYTTDEIRNNSATGYYYGSVISSYVF
ncbi:lipid A-modifier LpxR family protein [Flavobacterium sp. XGLA_31]|uniref:lipid A-modifier LpxR family protein n=1 Tax=Flavobacterium sp. XGLA_31 TaxID=3447666 RepID=UPI003F348114